MNNSDKKLDTNVKKFILRGILFLLAVCIALIKPQLLEKIFFYQFGFIRTYHILWLIFFVETIPVLIPCCNHYVGHGKQFQKHYIKAAYHEHDLERYTRQYNWGAFRAAIGWALVLIIITVLYAFHYLGNFHLFLIVLFFYFSDQFCINIWCPFRSWLVRNRCCTSCRIYNWDRLMIVSPLILIPSFWTYSLILISLVVLIQWEYLHYKYPERFSEISNLSLRCSNCNTPCKKSKKG